jgi:phosphoribosylamine--glycine ligase
MAEKFLMLSGGGDGLGLALRLRMEGNDVSVWIRESRSKQNYDGLLKKPERFDQALDADTIVIFDSSGGGRTADRLRARGHHVFAGSTFADQLELDRPLALSIMDQAGIRTPPSQTFRSWDKAKDFVSKHEERLVFKASGKTGDYLGSYVSYDKGDLLEMLEYFRDLTAGKGKPEFILQDFVEGQEISTEGWFNGQEFMLPWNHTIERKQLMNEGIGPSCGCAGNLVWSVKELNHVIEEGIARMAAVLRDNEYVGPIDLNTVVNDSGVWGLEFTPRFGYDALPALLELFEKPVGEVIASMARGERPTELPLSGKFAAGLRVSIPPYPSEHLHSDEGIPIRGLTRDDRDHLYFFDVKLNEANKLVSTAAFGAIVTVTGSSDDVSSVMDGPLEIAKRAKIPSKQYRTDLGRLFLEEWCKFDQFIRGEDVGTGIATTETVGGQAQVAAS